MKNLWLLLFITLFSVKAYAQTDIRLNGNYSTDDSLNFIFLKSQTLTDIDGKPISINDLKGKAVVFHFFETPSRSSVKSMLDLYRMHDHYKKEVVVIAVDMQQTDSNLKLKDFMTSNQYDFVYIPGKELSTQLKIQKIPYKLFINKDGHLVSAYEGAFPDIREYQRNVSLAEQCLYKNQTR